MPRRASESGVQGREPVVRTRRNKRTSTGNTPPHDTHPYTPPVMCIIIARLDLGAPLLVRPPNEVVREAAGDEPRRRVARAADAERNVEQLF